MATVSIYQLINPSNTGVSRTWNNPESAQMRTCQKSFPSNDITNYFFTIKHFLHSKHLIWKVSFYQNCCLMVALNRIIYQKMWKMSVFGLFNKIINFITESVKKPTIYDLLFLNGIYSPKISINIHLKWKISTRAVFLQ